jgi:hypothetical protein
MTTFRNVSDNQPPARRDADEELAESIAKIYAKSGPPSKEDRAWARQALGLEP